MAFQLPPMTVRGHRRHRYMEACDFNAAAVGILELLRRAVADGRVVGSCFFSVYMDPITPGNVDAIELPSVLAGPLSDALNSSPSPPVALQMGLLSLLHHAERPASLAAYIGTAHIHSKTERALVAQAPFHLCLELRSVDGLATAAYRLDSAAKRVHGAPLTFRGRR